MIIRQSDKKPILSRQYIILEPRYCKFTYNSIAKQICP